MEDKPCVLIVDDVPANLQILATCLKDRYHIKVATSGELCLRLAEYELKPDLILLDIEMPGMTGFETCKHLKNNPSTAAIPIIFVTSKDTDEDEELGLQLGAVDYLTKPIRPAIVAIRVQTHITLKQQRDKLQAMAMHDQLTSLYNRHYLLEVANHKVVRAKRHRQALSLLMVDIDHFKAINDQYGHPEGDLILQAVATAIKESHRREDVVARLGGEEFVVLLDQCDISAAQIKAQNLCQAIRDLNPRGINVTISIGVAQLHTAVEEFAGLLKRADIAVYQAKKQGRNRVVVIYT
ncbi:MAG: diguanylate cyclase [Methyloprofundus sp.]|nr:diguanylate cyclase [Methyloprofundus sp.]